MTNGEVEVRFRTRSELRKMAKDDPVNFAVENTVLLQSLHRDFQHHKEDHEKAERLRISAAKWWAVFALGLVGTLSGLYATFV